MGKIKPSSKAKGAGLLCGKCIMQKLKKLHNAYYSYKLVKN